MRSDIWESWLSYINEGFRIQNRHILLLADNAASHRIQTGENSLQLTNITLHYLPPNTTSHLQPMDAGIIHSFKAKYKQLYCKHILHQFERNINIEQLSKCFYALIQFYILWP